MSPNEIQLCKAAGATPEQLRAFKLDVTCTVARKIEQKLEPYEFAWLASGLRSFVKFGYEPLTEFEIRTEKSR